MPINFLNDNSSVFSGADPFEVSDYVNRHVGSHALKLAKSRDGSASMKHAKIGNIDLCHLNYGTRARVVSEGLADAYHVQFILRGHCRFEVYRDSLSLSAGHVLLINPEDPIDLTYSDDCEKFILKIPSSMFNDVCQEHNWSTPNGQVKYSQVPYQFEELQSLLCLLTLVCQEAESGTATPQMLQHYSRVVTSKLMTLLKHNIRLETASSHSVSFDRLVRYIEQNIKRDVSAEELAQYAHLSLRSLYLLFEKNARTTPKNFIRQRKLEQVYATLMNPASKAANITAVALDYGFTHLGRFSEFYKSTFGMLPSESLKSRQTTM